MLDGYNETDFISSGIDFNALIPASSKVIIVMASLVDVAKKAGVSKTTASRALSTTGASSLVSGETTASVLQAARALDYRAHPIARSLRTRETRTIGFLATETPGWRLSSLLHGVQKVLDGHGYRLLVSLPVRERTKEYCWADYFVHRVDGILAEGTCWVEGSDGDIDSISRTGMPLVLVCSESKMEGIPSVMIDNFGEARAAVNYLLTLGHRRIAFISGPRRSYDFHQRLLGYMAELKEHGIAHRPEWVVQDVLIDDSAYAKIRAFFAKAPDVTAIFAAHDRLALIVMHEARNLGRRVPEELSIVGFDDEPWARDIDPALTTVRQPAEELGRHAARLLLDVLSRENRSDQAEGGAVAGIVLKTDLVVRESAAPPCTG